LPTNDYSDIAEALNAEGMPLKVEL
jgi:hypothetical protein